MKIGRMIIEAGKYDESGCPHTDNGLNDTPGEAGLIFQGIDRHGKSKRTKIAGQIVIPLRNIPHTGDQSPSRKCAYTI